MESQLSGNALAMYDYLADQVGDRGSVKVVGEYPMFVVTMPAGNPSTWSVIFFGSDEDHETILDVPGIGRDEAPPWPEVREQLADTVALVALTDRRTRRTARREYDRRWGGTPRWWPF